MMPTMVRVTQAHIDAREDSIVESALILFARKGIEKTTVQEIAAAADLSAGAIYRYFPSKEKLLEAVFGHCILHQREVFESEGRNPASPLAALIDIGRHAVNEPADDPMRALDVELTLACKRDPEGVGVGRRAMRTVITEQVEQSLQRARDAGEIPESVAIRPLAVGLMALVAGIHVLQAELGDQVDGEAAFDAVSDLVSKGLLAR
jgi:AcrR family transcriptional regulator